MTSPGGKGGVSGFEYSDDSVVAKVSVEVSTQDLDNLFQLSNRTETLRVGLEAVARSQGDFNEYLKQLPEIQQRATTAQQAYLDVLKQSVEMQERLRLAAGSAGAGGSTLGQPDAFAGQTVGMGGVSPGAAAVPQTLAQAAAGLGQLQQQDPRAAASWGAAHQMPTDRQSLAALYPSLRQQEEDTKAHVQNRAQQHAGGGPSTGSAAGQFKDMTTGMADAAQMVLNETQPGGSMLRLGARAMNGAAHMLGKHQSPATGDDATQDLGGGGGRPGSGGPMDFLGGLGDGVLDGMGLKGIGGLAKGFGLGSAALTGALALNRIVQNSGEEYQQYKNLGMMRGGGAMEGYGYEIQARMLALDPFISTEQSRQIIQAALRDGYTGKEYDSVTSFIASNLKDMNMSVNESVQALHKSIETGGQSLQGFTAQMEVLKEASKSGVRTYDDMKAAVEANTASGVDRGMSGGAAGAFASANAMAFKDNRILATAGDRFAGAVLSNDRYLGQVGAIAGMPNAMPGEVPYADPNFTKDAWGPMVELAQSLKGDPHGAELFYQNVQAMLPEWGLTRAEAAEMFKYLQTQNPGTAGAAAAGKAAGEIIDRGVLSNGVTANNRKASDARSRMNKSIYQPFLDLFNPFNKGADGQTKGLWDEIKAIGDIPKNAWNANMDATYYSGRYQNPVMDQVIAQYGYNGVELVDANGKVVTLDSNNKQTMERLGSGELGWRQKGTSGPGTSLANTPGALQTGGTQGVQVGGVLTIQLDPAAQRVLSAPKAVTLTQNQAQAGAGYGNATMNGAPPGDR